MDEREGTVRERAAKNLLNKSFSLLLSPKVLKTKQEISLWSEIISPVSNTNQLFSYACHVTML